MYCGVPEEDPNKLIALILSGGESSRMGKDKGSLELNGERWVQRASKLCASLHIFVLHSIQTSQIDSYSAFLNSDTFIVDNVDIKGPLAGLLSFYLKYPSTDVLLLPCDMIQLNTTILSELMDTYEHIHIGHDIIVFEHEDGTIEPMPGIYTSEALRKIYWLFASGELINHSLKHSIEISNSFFIPIKKKDEAFFNNANTQDDINRIN
jgi:molybdopterin-guanine dinucleotide biosynthesis protein A